MGNLNFPAAVPALLIGGRSFTDLGGLITIGAGLTGATGRSVCRKPGAAAGYAVTAGKTLRIVGWRAVITTAVAASYASMAQVDVDIGVEVATAFTNPIYLFSDFGNASIVGGGTTGVFEGALPDGFPVAAGKYIGLVASGNLIGSFFLFGYET